MNKSTVCIHSGSSLPWSPSSSRAIRTVFVRGRGTESSGRNCEAVTAKACSLALAESGPEDSTDRTCGWALPAEANRSARSASCGSNAKVMTTSPSALIRSGDNPKARPKSDSKDQCRPEIPSMAEGASSVARVAVTLSTGCGTPPVTSVVTTTRFASAMEWSRAKSISCSTTAGLAITMRGFCGPCSATPFRRAVGSQPVRI